MNHLVPTALRTAPHKNGVAIRKKDKKDPLEFEVFLARWQSGLRAQSVVWEGPRAVAELQRKKMYKFLQCEQAEYHAKILVERMLEEMKAYQEEAMGRLAREHFDEVYQFLSREIDRFQAKEDKTTVPSLKTLLVRLKREVERARKTVGRLKRQKRDWHYGKWREFWPKHPRKNLVSRRIELDTRLQVELGKMLTDYLRPKERSERVSLESIARLILLAYLAGELATEEKRTGMIREKTLIVRTHATNRILNVRNIRDKLTSDGLDKAKSFRNRPSLKRR